MRLRSRRAYAEKAELGDLPKPEDAERRRRCEASLLDFLTTYFPQTAGL